jgi:phage baseplate assembly protein W
MSLIEVESLPRDIIFGAKDVLEVIQNCWTILTTQKGTVPLDREFGIAAEFLDSPMPVVRAKAEQDIFLAFRKYEPRAVLKEVYWKAEVISGKVMPNVKVQVVL